MCDLSYYSAGELGGFEPPSSPDLHQCSYLLNYASSPANIMGLFAPGASVSFLSFLHLQITPQSDP